MTALFSLLRRPGLAASAGLLAAMLLPGCSRTYGPVPSEAQLEWQKMEYNMFVHFGPNTFSGAEWGDGTEAEDIFCPTDLDCRQWARIARDAGMKGIILTAKHHDGFCLWPSSTSTHTVAQSSWRGGQADVLAELSAACREYGLKFGVYVSPWDRNHPAYGTPKYNKVFATALEEVHSNYGEVFEQWFDGACGEGPSGKKQEYDWPLFHSVVRRLSPKAIMFSDVGPGCRWMGNERGIAGETNWSRLDTEGFCPGAGAPPADTLQRGNVHGAHWIPAEVDVSIRPGWFWKESENSAVKSVEQLADIWFSSVGRNALLLLNVPPDKRGRICEVDSLRLMEFRDWREAVFGLDLADGAVVKVRRVGDMAGVVCKPLCVELDLPEMRTFDVIELRENISRGQRISSFVIQIPEHDAGWKTIAEGTTIGYKRLLRIPECRTRRIRVVITGSYARPLIDGVSLYHSPVSQSVDIQRDAEMTTSAFGSHAECR